jgi:hypothetical protein
MSEQAPTVVVLYSWRSGDPVRVAEFRRESDGPVSLTMIDPLDGRLAQEYYDHGIDLVSADRLVGPSEGADFMRALLQPFRMSYYRFADESPE